MGWEGPALLMAHAQAAPNSKQPATDTGARNLAFAVQERIAYASLCSVSERIEYREKNEDADAKHAALGTAQKRLHDFVLLRLRELQLLTRWPLAQPATEQLDHMHREYAGEPPWSIVGEAETLAQELPYLPELLRKDLWGATELLLALAGQLGKESPSGMAGSSSRSVALPRSLGMVTYLPALQTLQAPSIPWLRGFFADLRPQHRHVGVDDRHLPWFKDLKLHTARSLLKEGSAPMCRTFLRFGTPHGARAALWEAALCLAPLSQHDVSAFSVLCNSVLAQRSLLDVCVCDDLRFITDSEHFFLFEEVLRAVLLALSRDWQLPLHTPVEPQPSVVAAAAALAHVNTPSAASCDSAALAGGAGAAGSGGKGSEGRSTGLPTGGQPPPPCSMLLPQGMALLAAPLCYMMEHPAAVFRLFKSMYTRFWCKLHTLQLVDSHSPTLPLLVKLYEQLLQELDPDVVAHVHGTGIPIAALAMPWLCTAFAGQLPMEELLLLWDRVVGMDSLLPLPLMAVAIICFRRQAILACQSSAEVLEVVADITQLQTMPLLQAVLFSG